jgi:hypothetical protein
MFITKIILIISKISFILNYEINGEFQYCTHDGNSPVLNRRNCINDKDFNEIPLNVSGTYILLIEDQYAIDFVANKCKVFKLIYTTYKELFGKESNWPPSTSDIEISAVDCNLMMTTKLCYGFKMEKNNHENEWQYIGIPKRQYKRWTTLYFETYSCFLSTEKIQTNDLNVPVIYDHVSSCRHEDQYCKTHDATYVWKYEPKICKLKQVARVIMNFKRYKNKMIIVSDKESLFFDVLEKRIICGQDVIKTDLNFFITKSTLKYTYEIKKDIDINIYNHLSLASTNYNFYKAFKDIEQLHNILISEQCILYNNILSLITVKANE